MASFAIIRQDGEVDKVQGESVTDVSARYGWPGNGDIQPWDDGKHNGGLRWSFDTPAEHHDKLNAEASSEVAIYGSKASADTDADSDDGSTDGDDDGEDK